MKTAGNCHDDRLRQGIHGGKLWREFRTLRDRARQVQIGGRFIVLKEKPEKQHRLQITADFGHDEFGVGMANGTFETRVRRIEQFVCHYLERFLVKLLLRHFPAGSAKRGRRRH